MGVPDYQSLMLPVLRCAAVGEVSVPECIERFAPEVGLTDDDLRELLPSGQALIANRTHWAKTYLARAGVIEMTRRGHFRATARGRALLSEHPDRVDNSVLARFPEFVAWREQRQSAEKGMAKTSASEPSAIADAATPEDRIADAYSALDAALRADILERLLQSSPSVFEGVVVDLLVAMGYGGGRADMGKAVGRSGDGGIDGIIKEDALGLDIVYVQAKRYKPEVSVGRPDVQSFAGSLDGVGATKGLFVTTSSFTSGAKEYADKIAKRIILIDGGELSRLMVRNNVGVRPRDVYEVKKIDEDYFEQ